MWSRPRSIAHIHVWDKSNKGDLGIVLAVQEQLRAAYPGVKIIDFPIEVLKKFNRRRAAAINRADLVIFGGGGVFYRYFLPFSGEMIKAIKIPLVIYGVGYIREVGAPALSKKERASLVTLVKQARLVGVRENYTKTFLVRQGILAAKIKVIGDPAFCLKEIKPDKIPSGFKLGLNLNYSGWLGFGRWEEDILKAYRATAEFFQNKYDAQVYYLQHHPGEKKIYPKLKIKNLKIIDLKPAAQKGFYGTLDLVIGMMLHSCVLAAGALTPEINVAYDLRNRNFARFIGCPELVVELADLKSGGLLKKARTIVKNRAVYRQKFATVKKRIKLASTALLVQTQKLIN
ncbi:MAG: polysaccharide pyruvyl transferase family protein [Candidatus Falkowbacteria bacterium]|nr:polysaccharide pyruvyl transferase family protein [Candidatus Falkowbacteria bacterium]